MKKESVSRILEAFAYIAKNAPENKRNIYNVLKVFYMADKLHMERYGRFIFDDWYVALAKGPVPSQTYDFIKAIQAGASLPYGLSSTIAIEKHQIIPIRDADEDLFSESDLICLNEIMDLSKKQDLGDISHDKAWKDTPRNRPIDINMILSTLDSSNELIDLNRNRYV